MSQIIPNLWIGGIASVSDTKRLRQNGIEYVLSVMRGHVPLDPIGLIRYQVELNDTEYSDLLVHIPPCIAFLEKAMASGKGVMVHCQAGMSRSPAIVAAYLMYTRKIDFPTALALIREKRGIANPNPSFVKQLEIFYNASCTVTPEDKATRAFYLERAVTEILSPLLFLRVHGLRLTSTSSEGQKASSTILAKPGDASTPGKPSRRIRCRMCRHELASSENMFHTGPVPYASQKTLYRRKSQTDVAEGSTEAGPPSTDPEPVQAAKTSENIMQNLKSKEPPSLVSTTSGALGVEAKAAALDTQLSQMTISTSETEPKPSSGLGSIYSKAQHVVPPASRPPVARPTPKGGPGALSGPTPTPPAVPSPAASKAPPPELTAAECSGYFLEPMIWMESFLDQGLIEGKIMCPNEKCGAKLGNYAWPGLHCGCDTWITPGFCIHKTKVDELW